MLPGRWSSLLIFVVIGPLWGCGVSNWEPSLLPDGAPIPTQETAPFLKAHLTSGELVVFSGWKVPTDQDSRLDGFGVRYSVDRVQGLAELQSVPMDSIALLEANRKETVGRFAFSGLTVWTVLSTMVTVACVADPKSCFGSCPTFYIEDGASEQLVAEGFSASPAKVFEAHDVDALPWTRRGDGDYSILMRNEAPETHAIRSLHLLAVPKPAAGSVYSTTSGRFREGSPIRELERCRVLGANEESDCGPAMRSLDDKEFFSLADSFDLATREWIEIALPSVPNGEDAGIVIKGRASLLSTFLFYQTIAYAGEEAGRWLASLEAGEDSIAEKALGLPKALGPVEVFLETDGEWLEIGSFGEAGPIAPDQKVVALPSSHSGPVRIRLSMAKGAWRLDQVGLVELRDEVYPRVIEPTKAERVHGTLPSEMALDRLLDPERYLVTQQGDEYRVHFELPPGSEDWSVFLDSQGYYYEWMRGEWAGETNPLMTALILNDPEEALRRLAPAFKAREAGMEETFWSSRFRRKSP